jgi:hypothetical protein
VSEWPPIDEPELRERLALGDVEFRGFIRDLLAKFPPRAFDEEALARALEYPWARPEGSYLLADGEFDLLADLPAEERARAIRRLTAEEGRLSILAFGSNAGPGTLARKFAHFSEESDRTVLVLTGRLHDFDVGASAQPALYGSMPATLFPSPGTAVAAAVLWVTPAQLTQLTWSELSYRLGRLRARFEIDEGEERFDEVLAFVSRFGAFCVDGEPVALAAVPAAGRVAAALTQEQLLDSIAALAIGPGANAETLVRAIFEDLTGVAPQIAATVHADARPFESERWTPFEPRLR